MDSEPKKAETHAVVRAKLAGDEGIICSTYLTSYPPSTPPLQPNIPLTSPDIAYSRALLAQADGVTLALPSSLASPSPGTEVTVRVVTLGMDINKELCLRDKPGMKICLVMQGSVEVRLMCEVLEEFTVEEGGIWRVRGGEGCHCWASGLGEVARVGVFGV